MIRGKMKIRPRYGEVDKMGYVYHANYVSYCHQARTELLRSIGINDKTLEDKNIMVPVIAFSIDYKKPAHYDEVLSIITSIEEIPKVRFNFSFEILNEQKRVVCKAKSTIVFVNCKTRVPMVVPDFVRDTIEKQFKHSAICEG